MPIDEASRRLAFLLQIDLRRFVDRETSRQDRGETVRYDSVTRMATCEDKRGEAIARWVATDWPRIKRGPADAGPGSSSKTSPGSRSFPR